MTPSLCSPCSSCPSRGSGSPSAATCLGSALLAVAAASCVREPAERSCPEVAAGALVVSELGAAPRGEPSWVELVNVAEHEVDLLGVGVRMRRLDGGAEQRSLVREERGGGAGAPGGVWRGGAG